MTYTTIDSIVRKNLLENGLTIHYYIRFLSFALDCLKELNIDTLPKIKSVRIPVDRFGCIKLPFDYIGYVRVGVQNGVYIQELGSNASFNRLVNENDDGTLVVFPEPTNVYSIFDTTNVNSSSYVSPKLEHLGKIFGIGEGARSDVFQVVPEANLMRIGSGLVEGDEVVLDYLY